MDRGERVSVNQIAPGRAVPEAPRMISRPRSTSGPAWRLVAAALAWLIVLGNAAILVVLWWRGGGVTAVHDLGTGLTSAGRITGLLGAYDLLLQILLLSRLPVVEQLVGFDKLSVWHRVNGKACLYLILGHVVFITAGYTLMDRVSLGKEISLLLETYPGMVTATVGTVLIVLVAVSSYLIVRRHLRYELWYVVHLTAYLGALLTWFHEIPTGNELVTNAAAAAYWTALYLVTLALVVLLRFGKPILFNLRHRLRVEAVVPEDGGAISIYITGRHLDQIGARAGQFFLWRFLAGRMGLESHPFSLSAHPGSGPLRITVKNLGDFSGSLGVLTPGTRVLAEGPFGRFTASRQRRERVLLIAGGIGITPVRALLDEVRGDVTVLYRVRSESDAVFKRELEEHALRRGVRLRFVTGPRKQDDGTVALSARHLVELVPDIAEHDVYICGPVGFTEWVETSARHAGVPGGAIYSERFALAE